MNPTNLQNAINSVIDQQSGRFGEYEAKFGRVWRNGKVIAYVDNDLVVPSEFAVSVEKHGIEKVNDELNANVTKPNKDAFISPGDETPDAPLPDDKRVTDKGPGQTPVDMGLETSPEGPDSASHHIDHPSKAPRHLSPEEEEEERKKKAKASPNAGIVPGDKRPMPDLPVLTIKESISEFLSENEINSPLKGDSIVEDAEHSYWNSNGKYQREAEMLRELIPVEGPVPDARTKNKCLERFRKAVNCYYDLFNNGLCNRAAEFRQIYGFSPERGYSPGSRYKDVIFNDELYDKVDHVLDNIILKAAEEQSIKREKIDAVVDESLNEAEERGFKDLRDIRSVYVVRIHQREDSEHFETINGQDHCYEAVQFTLTLVTRHDDKLANREFFDYTVWHGSQIPPEEVISKQIKQELENNCEYCQLNPKDIENLAREVFVKMDAVRRNSPQEPKYTGEEAKQGAHVVGKLREAANE